MIVLIIGRWSEHMLRRTIIALLSQPPRLACSRRPLHLPEGALVEAAFTVVAVSTAVAFTAVVSGEQALGSD